MPRNISIIANDVALAGNSQLMLSVGSSLVVAVTYGNAAITYNISVAIGSSGFYDMQIFLSFLVDS